MSPHPVSGLQRHDKGDRLVAICNADTTSKVSYFKIAERQGWFFAKIIPVIGDGRHGEQVTSPLCSPRDDLNGPALCINILEEILQPGLRGFSGIYRRAHGHTGKRQSSRLRKKRPRTESRRGVESLRVQSDAFPAQGSGMRNRIDGPCRVKLEISPMPRDFFPSRSRQIGSLGDHG